MIAAVYVRVSTEGQERDGTSLASQLEACFAKAAELGHEVPPEYAFRDTYTGAELDRPNLTRLRDAVRQREVQAVICYSTDRLSRKALHVAMLAEEFQRRKVDLVFVTEPLDSSPEGQLIQYVKGYAAELEREKIRDRSRRGIRSRALMGKLPSGSHCRLYGYDYDKQTGTRAVNEGQALWVRKIFEWSQDGDTPRTIARKLNELKVPTHSGGTFWYRPQIVYMLRNTAYAGVTYCNTQTRVEPRRKIRAITKVVKTGLVKKPRDQWIEIPGATPPIISRELFDAVQLRLDERRQYHGPVAKRDYLLRGLVICGLCGGRYLGRTKVDPKKRGPAYERRIYACRRRQLGNAENRCAGRQVRAGEVEDLVWGQVKQVLTQPEVVYQQLVDRRRAGETSEYWLSQLDRIEVRLNALKTQEKRLLKAMTFGFEADMVSTEKHGIDTERLMLQREQASAIKQMELARDQNVELDAVLRFCRRVLGNIEACGPDDKRRLLEMLNIRVVVDPSGIIIRGIVPEAGRLDTKHPAGLEFVTPVPEAGSHLYSTRP